MVEIETCNIGTEALILTVDALACSRHLDCGDGAKRCEQEK